MVGSGTPAANNVGESVCHSVGIRVVGEEDTVADIMILTGPEFTIGVVWSNDQVAVKSEAHRCLIRKIGSGEVSDGESRGSGLAVAILAILAQLRYYRLGGLASDTSTD